MFEALLLLGTVFDVAAIERPTFSLKMPPAFGLKVQATGPAPARPAPRLVCSMIVVVADPDVDRDFVKTMEHSVDPAFTKVSECEATEVRRLK